MNGFHEILFPLDIALGSRGGPQRMTDIVTTGSGREERNQRWFASRRRFDAGYGVRTLEAIATIIEFFEERRGMLYGFRWRDKADHKSCSLRSAPSPFDQVIGTGDGATSEFQLIKTYGVDFSPYARIIRKPVVGSVRIAAGGSELPPTDYSLDHATGIVTFLPGHTPATGVPVSAGYLFDVPVRFETDYLEIDIAAFEAGEIPKIPLIEIPV